MKRPQVARSAVGQRKRKENNPTRSRQHSSHRAPKSAQLQSGLAASRTARPKIPRREAVGVGRLGGYGEGPNTRSHPELGRESPQRRWYCVLRRGRVGRRQAFQHQTLRVSLVPPNAQSRCLRPFCSAYRAVALLEAGLSALK